MKLAIASDHAGFDLKKNVLDFLARNQIQAEDLGTYNRDPVDYPDYAEKMAEAILDQNNARGILICGSGVGISIAANKIPGIRAAVCSDTYSAHQGVEHDDQNILVLGAWITGEKLAIDIIQAFLKSQFSREPRHVRRLEKLKKIEQKYIKKTKAA
jgi:ribose 5-phosphate isomerase B